MRSSLSPLDEVGDTAAAVWSVVDMAEGFAVVEESLAEAEVMLSLLAASLVSSLVKEATAEEDVVWLRLAGAEVGEFGLTAAVEFWFIVPIATIPSFPATSRNGPLLAKTF